MRVATAITSLLVALAATTQAEKDTAKCNLVCAKGEKCELQTVQCITTPCNPIPTCVPAKTKPDPAVCTKTCPKNEKCYVDSLSNEQLCLSPCATVRCADGYTCVAEQVQCVRAPCPPIAVCKPNY